MNRFDIALKKQLKAPSDKDLLSAKVWLRLCDYTEFDVDDLLAQNDAVIFGGSVRDSIADMEIHDVDIMALPVSARAIRSRLIKYGYNFVSEMVKMDIDRLYTGIQVIHEPWTFFNHKRIIQIIRPRIPPRPARGSARGCQEIFRTLLFNVDISACGVLYDGKVLEPVQGAIQDCILKRFSVNPTALMVQKDRISGRIRKLEQRGWMRVDKKEIAPPGDFVQKLSEREMTEAQRLNAQQIEHWGVNNLISSG